MTTRTNPILSLMLMAALPMCMFGTTVEQNKSEEEYRKDLSILLTQEKFTDITKIGNEKQFWALSKRADLKALLEYADSELAKKGYGGQWRECNTWKKISAIKRKEIGADIAYKICLETANRYETPIDFCAFAKKGASIGELILCFNEFLTFPEKCYPSSELIDKAKKGIQIAAPKAIKRALRQQGKSFVTKDGINPCEVYMERLNKALNAPRLDGLNEWLSELGFSERVDTSKLPTRDKIEELKKDIYYGEKEPTTLDKTILSVCLGVDGYNEFVKKYNGE